MNLFMYWISKLKMTYKKENFQKNMLTQIIEFRLFYKLNCFNFSENIGIFKQKTFDLNT